MAKYCVTLQYQRTEVIEVEADSKDDAIELVNEGEFDDDQITHTEDDYVEILGATCVDAEPLIAN
jgi:hypothetical protein